MWLRHKRQRTRGDFFFFAVALVVPLCVQQFSGSDDTLDQGVRPHRLLRRRLGAGVRVPALLVPHGFDVAAAPHPATRDLVILPVPRVTAPVVLRHLRVEIQKVSGLLRNVFVPLVRR